MYRVKKLSQKEIDAQNEIGQLQKELETSHYREEVARTSLKTMTREISMKEESIKQATDSLASQERQIATLEAEQNSLESRLENALMSNEIAFEEIKSESMQIQRERDSLRLALSKSETKNKSLTSELQIAEHQKRQAEMVIEELDQSNGSNIHFEVSVMRSKEPFESFPTKLGSEFSVYRSNGGEECTVGHYSTMKAAAIPIVGEYS
jgi:chromosome segregation ATPase